ncbi:MAG TPA: hypothetical protein VF168_12560 [Trueperaceae bacterium]
MAGADLLLMLAAQAADFSTSTQGHGAPTAKPLDFAITSLGTLVVLLVVVYALKFFVTPRERSSEHIKRRILREEG